MLSWRLLFLCALSSQPTVTEGTAVQITTFTPKNTQKKHKESISFPQSTNGESTKRDCLLTSASKMTSFCCVYFLFVVFCVCFCGIHLHTTLTSPLESETQCLMIPWCSPEGGPAVFLQSGSGNLVNCVHMSFPCKINQIWEKKIPSNSFRIGRFF